MLAWCGVILALTLRPSPNTLTTPGLCLVCGDRGVADALLNVALFVPFGLAGRRMGLRVDILVALGLGLSASVEAIQFFTPGRDASLGDLLFNGTGSLAGGLLAPRLEAVLRPDQRLAGRLSIGWGLSVALGFVLLGWLLEPRFPDGPLALSTRPPGPEGGIFQGAVLRLEPGTRAASEGAVAWGRRPGERDRLEARFTAVPPRWSFRPIAGLLDARTSEPALLWGPKGDDMVLRLRRHADALRLTAADLRLRDVLSEALVGDTLAAAVWREGEAYCLSLEARAACGLGYSVGSGWALLLPSAWADGGADRWLDGLWLALLILPIGHWGGRRGRGIFALGLACAGAVLVPAATALLAAPVVTWGGLVSGWLAGLASRRLFGGWLRPARRFGSVHQQMP